MVAVINLSGQSSLHFQWVILQGTRSLPEIEKRFVLEAISRQPSAVSLENAATLNAYCNRALGIGYRKLYLIFNFNF
ncbi:MAG: hypothetical protein SW833_15120 [Cyanobacteriota bacterium]|nr:hypothetical protein [Cyanobacteriota bacterium]